MKRSAPMKRSAFKRRVKPAFTKSLSIKERGSPLKKRSVTSKIRQSARMQECTLRFPVCNHNPETTVLCHSNRLIDGKGMGLKAPDTEAAYGCSRCHDLLDGRMQLPDGMTNEDVQLGFDKGRERTQMILKSLGLMK